MVNFLGYGGPLCYSLEQSMFLINRKQNEQFTSWVIMEDLDWVDEYAQRSLKNDPMFMKFKLDAEGNPKTIDELSACLNESLATQDNVPTPCSVISHGILRRFEKKARELDAEFRNYLNAIAQYRSQGTEMCLSMRCKLDGEGKPLMVQVRAMNTDIVQMVPDEDYCLVPYETIKQLYPNVEKFFVNKGIRPFLPGRSSPGIRGFMTRNAHLQPAHPAEIMNAPQQPAPSPQTAVAPKPAAAPLPPAAPQPEAVPEPPSKPEPNKPFNKLPSTMKELSKLVGTFSYCAKYDFGVGELPKMPSNKIPTAKKAKAVAEKMMLFAVARALVAREYNVGFSTDDIIRSVMDDWNRYSRLSPYRAVMPEIPWLKYAVTGFIEKPIGKSMAEKIKWLSEYVGQMWSIKTVIRYITKDKKIRLQEISTPRKDPKSSLEAIGKFSDDGVFEYDGKLTNRDRTWLSRHNIKAVKHHTN